jgi:hypothetical protein
MSETTGTGTGSGIGGVGGEVGRAIGREAGRAGGEVGGEVGRATVRAGGGNGAEPARGREAYSFACMHCGYGWEQTYEIEHYTDLAGRPCVTYLADGRKVPSPLTRPTCDNCGGHQVRIMRPGRVSDAVAAQWSLEHAERGVHRARHWPTLHFLRRKEAPPREDDSRPSWRLWP